MERYEDAQKLLRELLRSYNDNDDELRRANLIAMETHLESMGISSVSFSLICLFMFKVIYILGSSN